MPVDIANFSKNGTEGKIQAVRVDAGSLPASSNTTVIITWPSPFADANYSVAAVTFEDTLNRSTDTTVVRHIFSKTAAGVSVIVGTGTNAYTPGQGFLHCIGFHD